MVIRLKTAPAASAEISRGSRRRKARKRRRDAKLTPNLAILRSQSSTEAPGVVERIDLRPYQVEAKLAALRYLGRDQGGGYCLFLEQRTGKTPVTCSLVQECKPERVLIACPDIAIKVWEKHFLKYGLYEGREVKILNFQSLWSLRKWIRKWKPDMVIVDESHRIKGRNSKQGKMLRKLGLLATWRLALTGTPLEGKIWDAWAQFDFIDPDVFGTWDEFRTRYLVYGGFKGRQIVGTQNVEDFELKFKSRYYRVLLEEVKEVPTDVAPPNLVVFDLDARTQSAYDSMQEKFVVGVQPEYHRVKVGGRFVQKKKRIVAPRVITQIMKLHQLSGGFILDEEKKLHRFGDEKLARCGELMMQLGKVPIVVVVRFIPELYRIAALCRRMGRTVTLISGSHEFDGDFKTDVAIVQIRSGLAIDLSRAEEFIFYSWGHSFLDYDQARFRILSYTSVRARYHYLIARGTIDEDLYQVVTEKKGIVQLVLDKYARRRP